VVSNHLLKHIKDL